jgi:hypothetical protein
MVVAQATPATPKLRVRPSTWFNMTLVSPTRAIRARVTRVRPMRLKKLVTHQRAKAPTSPLTRGIQQVSVRFRTAWMPVLKKSGAASAMTARRSTRRLL